MKVFADENIPRRTIAALQAMGHTIVDIRGTADQGISDELLWQKVVEEQALLITTDKGFTNKRAEPHQGILIVRLRQPNREKIHQRILQALTQFPPAEWPGLTMVMRDQMQSIYRSQS